MDLVQVKIKQDDRILSYVKLIRSFDKTIPLGEIKKRIVEKRYVIEFDLDGRDWMYIENMTEYKWHMQFYRLLKQLETAGADMEIMIGGQSGNMTYLKNWMGTIRDIDHDCDKYPD